MEDEVFMQRSLVFLVCCFLFQLAAASDFLPAWQAFQVTVSADGTTRVWVKFNIAPEYHIYQNKIKITTLATSQVKLGKPLWPEPIILKSPDLGDFKVYENKTAIQIPIKNYADGQLQLQINYQGCKGLDLCFPEQQTRLQLDLTKLNLSPILLTEPEPSLSPAAPLEKQLSSVQAETLSLGSLLRDSSSSRQVAGFFANNLAMVSAGFF